MKAAITAAAENTKRLIDDQVSELYVRYDKTTELGETTREMAEIIRRDIVKFIALCQQILDNGTTMDVIRAGRQLHQQAAELKQTYTALKTQHPDILTFVAADVTALLVGQLASSATANQPLNSEGTLAL